MIVLRRLVGRLRSLIASTAPAQFAVVASVVVGMTLLTFFVLTWNVGLTGQVELHPGQVAPFEVVAPLQISYVSDLLTTQARDRAANAVPDQYDNAAGTIRRQQVISARELIADLSRIRNDETLDTAAKVEAMVTIADLGLGLTTAEAILALSDEEWLQGMGEAPQALDRAMRDEIRQEDLGAAQRRVPTLVSADLNEAASQVVVYLVQALIRPNSFFNEVLTLEMRERAREEIAPISVTIERGETILRAGDIATPEDVEALQQIGLLADPWDAWELVRALAFTLLVVSVTVGALYATRTQTPHRLRELAILLLLTVVWLIAAKFMITPHDWLPYLYPLAAMSMLAACLVHVRTAVVLTIAFALVVHYLAGTSSILVVYMLAGGLTGALVLGRAERITVFLWAALAVAVANILSVIAYRLPFDGMSNPQIVQLGFVLLLNGGLSASIALLGYFGLGNLFGLTTSLQLNELSRPTHPLLRQLLLKAPGTYHHTIVVSNLAERAAAAIGADALLARVGAYYHDIGKTVRPYFFTENIADNASPHDRLDPLTSAQIIISHVRDGIDLAQKYRLPRRIQDFIREHHGRSLVQYFYVRAVRSAEKSEVVDPEEFRYPGPRPHSKETAVLALADTCEAAVRSMRPGTREDLATIINNLIDERVAEGELSESPLTFGDLQTIREVFIQVLLGVHHPRITYPDQGRKEKPAVAAGEGDNQLPAAAIAAVAATGTANGTATADNRVLPPVTDSVTANDLAQERSPRAAPAPNHAGVEEMHESPEMASVDKAG